MKKQGDSSRFVQISEASILIVDEDETLREMLAIALRSEGFCSVYPVCNASEALHFTRAYLPDLLIIDYELSSITGLQLYNQIHQASKFPPIPGILVSAPLLLEEVGPHPLWIVQEPFELDTFFAFVRRALLVSSRQRTEVSLHRLKEVILIMRAKGTSLLSALHVLSLGFFCGLVSIPLAGLLLRSLILYLRRRREALISPVVLYPQVRTERGVVIRVIPRSLAEYERESAHSLVKAR